MNNIGFWTTRRDRRKHVFKMMSKNRCLVVSHVTSFFIYFGWFFFFFCGLLSSVAVASSSSSTALFFPSAFDEVDGAHVVFCEMLALSIDAE